MTAHWDAGTTAGWALIFDLDGVLSDTEEHHLRSWQRVAEEAGVPFAEDLSGRLRGRSREHGLQTLLGDRVSDEDRTRWLARKNEIYLDSIAALGPRDLAPGAASLLEEAERSAIPLGLASASRNARLVCGRLGILDRFRAIADGCSGLRPKPAADSFLWVAGRLGLPPRLCTVIEDSPASLAAARAAGFATVAVGEWAAAAQADLHVADLGGLGLSRLRPEGARTSREAGG